MKVIFTGGHHSAALPVIHKIREKQLSIEIHWIGHRHSLKNDKNKIVVISGIGARNYYRKLGYEREGAYMVKNGLC